MNKTCLIISGGELCDIPSSWRKAELVIACDHGWEYAETLGVVPDLIVGDFDSSPVPDKKIPIKRLPTRKDDTDTMYAVREALDRGCSRLAICCALGGRLDHTIANIQSAAFAAERGVNCSIFGRDTEIAVLAQGAYSFPKRAGWSFSLFALSDRCSGVSVKGTKFECEDISLTNSFPLGVSNVWEADEAAVSLKRGILMVVQSRLREGEHI